MGIAEQMGRTLQRTSISVNIKERLDFSCAMFGPDGSLVANAPHLPVHLGAMSEAVRFQVSASEVQSVSCASCGASCSADGCMAPGCGCAPAKPLAGTWPLCLQLRYWTQGQGWREGLHEGDVLVANHPQGAGGSHLPDITVMTPVFNDGRIVFFVASRWATPAGQQAHTALVSTPAAYRQHVRWPE